MSWSLETKMSGHASVAGVVGQVETKGIKITESDKTISCKGKREIPLNIASLYIPST